MKDYKIEELSNITEIIMGQSPSSDTYNEEGEGIPFFQGKAEFGRKYPEVKKYCSQPIKLAKQNDILMSVRAPVGSINIANTDCCIGRGLCAIRPNLELNFLYLYHFMKLNEREIEGLGQGSTFKAINKQDVERIKIPVLPLPIQAQIVAILEKAGRLKEKREQANQETNKIIQSVFYEMFGDPQINLYNFKTAVLKEIMSVPPQNGLYKPSSEYTKDGKGTPILRIDGFYDGKLTGLTELKRLNCTEKEIELYRLQNNNIVINRVNSMEYLGKCALIEGLQEDTVFESNMIRLKIDFNKANPIFLVSLLCTKFIYNQILQKAKKAVNQASINQVDVCNFEIVVPPTELQNEFASIVEKVESLKERQRQSTQEINTLFDALLQKAFNGELVV
jgi:type I restriction enzyme, S subunit